MTTGTYSDYHVEAIFDDLELAEEFAGKENGRVEVYPLNAQPRQRKYLRVRMRKNGEVDKVCQISEEDVRVIGEESEPRFSYDYYQHGVSRSMAAPENWVLVYDVSGYLGEERAIKVVNEKRAQILAHNTWGHWAQTRRVLLGDPLGEETT